MWVIGNGALTGLSAGRERPCVVVPGAIREPWRWYFFRFAEVMPITPATYRLIAGAVSDEGLECNGERIPLARENRDRVAAAVTAMRAKPKPKAGPGAGAELGSFRQRLDGLLTEAHGIANHPDRRLELIGLLEEGGESLQRLALTLREKTLVLR